MIASIGHDYPLMQFVSLLGGKGRPNMTPFRAARLVNNPENIRPELGFMNQAKARGIEPIAKIIVKILKLIKTKNAKIQSIAE